MKFINKDILEEDVQGAINKWLRSQIKNKPNDIESVYDDICISELIEKWQKERKSK